MVVKYISSKCHKYGDDIVLAYIIPPQVLRDGSKWLHPGKYHIIIGKQHMFTVMLHGYSALWKRFR
jgi:hypothetical protein